MRALLASTLLALLLPGSARAYLGGDLASVQADQQAWGAGVTQTFVAGATVYSQLLPNGVTVRQYVDPSGRVFAVAWEGPVQPDFERLLGSAFAAYLDALSKQRRGVSVQSAALVLESGGMMRAFTGRALLPAKLPAALSAQDIR